MQFSNVLCNEETLLRKQNMAGKPRVIRRDNFKADIMSESQAPLCNLYIFYDRTAFFFRTIFTDGHEIVVIVLKPVCSLASVPARSFNFYLLASFRSLLRP